MATPTISPATFALLNQHGMDRRIFNDCCQIYHVAIPCTTIRLEETETEIILHQRRFQIRGVKWPKANSSDLAALTHKKSGFHRR